MAIAAAGYSSLSATPATAAGSSGPAAAAGTAASGRAIELVVSSDGSRPSSADFEVQPARKRPARTNSTNLPAAMSTCTRDKTDRRQPADPGHSLTGNHQESLNQMHPVALGGQRGEEPVPSPL